MDISDRPPEQNVLCGACGRELGMSEAPAESKKQPRRPRRWLRNDLGILFLLLLPLIDVIGMGLSQFIPAVQQARERGRRGQCHNRLTQIGQAMRNYHHIHGRFPPPYTVDEAGNPLHSWRVLLLPYLDRADLYCQIHLGEPWNSPHNRRFAEKIPCVYQCPSDLSEPPRSTTDYLMITGPGTVGDGPEGTALAEITDGPENTLLVAETCDSGINWMQPVDFDAATMSHHINGPDDSPAGPSIRSYHPGLACILFCDGSVRTLSNETPADVVKALLTTAGGEQVTLPQDTTNK